MEETSQATLRSLLVSSYDELRKRLSRRLGSEDFANEVLHETYLRVARMNTVAVVQDPRAYLYRIALNLAADHCQIDSRRLGRSEIEALRHIADGALDPARIAEGRRDIEALERALNELPARRRAIFIASRLEEAPHREIASRFGISTRMVEKELKRALEHCGERLERKIVRRFGPRSEEQS
ncbi:RNA polymerase sigma factor [Bradyrhizobium roseum]|uniref:RNA polymerase sigma factor n=1 Tax=Bradyrhizobium roseum TaxID=3056648 RepID=UPI002610E47C|nr:sigma-70 family RNA polymerase sigma factor [Bradyrhizobium roseus]WKA26138.1 sigma-70 family RNA polymerase sigma factor [Bradyrhizobium roseus]